MLLARLCCPHCGSPLPAAPGLLLFACPACGAAAQLAAGRLERVPASAIRPRLESGGRPVGLLPFWIFRVAGATRADRCAVPALCPDNGAAFLRLGRALSMDSGAWEPWPAAARPTCGGQLTAADAARLADTILLACVPSAERCRLLDSGEAPWRLGPPALTYLPFARSAARLQDLLVGVEVSDRLLGRIPWAEAAVEPHAPEPCPAAP